MTNKKSSSLYIGLALVVIGAISLLNTLGRLHLSKSWWLPIILMIIGLMVIITRRGLVSILGWLCLVFGGLLLLGTLNLIHVLFLWELEAVSWVLFGLILIL